MTLLEKATLAFCLYCSWELASIPIAESGDEPLAVPLSLYQALVFNRRVGDGP
jgi:hypothetical protein